MPGAKKVTSRLGELYSDVNISNPINGDVLCIENDFWVNKSISAVATPAGANGDIQFNDANVFGAVGTLAYNKTAHQLTLEPFSGSSPLVIASSGSTQTFLSTKDLLDNVLIELGASGASLGYLELSDTDGSTKVFVSAKGSTFKSYSSSDVAVTVQAVAGQVANMFEAESSDGVPKFVISATGRLGIQTVSPSAGIEVKTESSSAKGIIVKSSTGQTANLMEWQASDGSPLALVDASGNFYAKSKSFRINHPTKAGRQLVYASLEGPEHSVYVRGHVEGNDECVITLPEYWAELVDENSLTVNLAATEFAQPWLFVKSKNAKEIVVSSKGKMAFDYTVYAKRKDVPDLEVEVGSKL